MSPVALESGSDATVEIRLADPQGQPITDARVVASLNTAAHGMQPSIAPADPRSDGAYVAVLKPLGMKGAHYINVDFQWKAGRTRRASTT